MGKWIAGGLALLLVIWGWSGYNRLVTFSQEVNEKWAQVENVYQRRADLIPNIARTAERYAKHEKSTLEAVIEARSKATQVTLKADELTPDKLVAFQKVQGELSSALARLMVVVEKYPDLKANTLFQEMMTQLEGTENRIAVARKDYNAVAKEYNTAVQRFPTNILANFTGFKERPYFQAEEGAKKAPEVFKEEGGK